MCGFLRIVYSKGEPEIYRWLFGVPPVQRLRPLLNRGELRRWLKIVTYVVLFISRNSLKSGVWSWIEKFYTRELCSQHDFSESLQLNMTTKWSKIVEITCCSSLGEEKLCLIDDHDMLFLNVGHYIPQLAARTLEYNKMPNIKPINLKAIAVNPWTFCSRSFLFQWFLPYEFMWLFFDFNVAAGEPTARLGH